MRYLPQILLADFDKWETQKESEARLKKCICGKENCEIYNCEHERK